MVAGITVFNTAAGNGCTHSIHGDADHLVNMFINGEGLVTIQ
jgi:hypothetical protein